MCRLRQSSSIPIDFRPLLWLGRPKVKVGRTKVFSIKKREMFCDMNLNNGEDNKDRSVTKCRPGSLKKTKKKVVPKVDGSEPMLHYFERKRVCPELLKWDKDGDRCTQIKKVWCPAQQEEKPTDLCSIAASHFPSKSAREERKFLICFPFL